MDVVKAGKSSFEWDTAFFLAIVTSDPDDDMNLMPSCGCAIESSVA